MSSNADLRLSPDAQLAQCNSGKSGRAARSLRLALVQMPFAITAWPSLGLSLLKAIATDAGHDVRIFYFNQAFQDEIGIDLYSKLARGAPQNVDLLGEWLFSEALFGRDAAAGVVDHQADGVSGPPRADQDPAFLGIAQRVGDEVLDRAAQEEVGRDLERIQTYLRSPGNLPSTQGVAIFACEPIGTPP